MFCLNICHRCFGMIKDAWCSFLPLFLPFIKFNAGSEQCTFSACMLYPYSLWPPKWMPCILAWRWLYPITWPCVCESWWKLESLQPNQQLWHQVRKTVGLNRLLTSITRYTGPRSINVNLYNKHCFKDLKQYSRSFSIVYSRSDLSVLHGTVKTVQFNLWRTGLRMVKSGH